MITHCLQDETLEFVKDDEVFVDDVELFSVLELALEDPDFLEIIELATDRVDLFVEFTRQLSDEIFIVWMEKKQRQ